MQATLSDALTVLRSSPMIFALCLMVISYGVGHRLFEFAWKGQLRLQYPSALAYQVRTLPCTHARQQTVSHHMPAPVIRHAPMCQHRLR